MKYVERRPGPGLRPHVECVWAVWDERDVADRPTERILPDGCPELILHLGDPFARRDEQGGWRKQPPAFLAGTLTRPWKLRPGGHPRTLGVRFRPGAARCVLDVPLDEIADRETAAEDLWGAARRVAFCQYAGAGSGIESGHQVPPERSRSHDAQQARVGVRGSPGGLDLGPAAVPPRRPLPARLAPGALGGDDGGRGDGRALARAQGRRPARHAPRRQGRPDA